MKKFKRLAALIDKSAWLLMLPALVIVYLADPAMLCTLLQWTAFFGIIAGIAVVISRIIFPQIHLEDLIQRALEQRNPAAGMIVSAVIVFVGILIYAMVVWAKT